MCSSDKVEPGRIVRLRESEINGEVNERVGRRGVGNDVRGNFNLILLYFIVVVYGTDLICYVTLSYLVIVICFTTLF